MKHVFYVCMLFFSAVLVSCGHPYMYYYEDETDQVQDTMNEPASEYSVEEMGEYYEVEHSWQCEGEDYSVTLNISEDLYDYYRNDREHSAYTIMFNGKEVEPNYFGFILSEHDRSVIRMLADEFSGRAATEKEKIQLALTFVQSLPYAYDTDSKGVDEYMRYPIETLVDGCGDCEDKSALLAAILYEMDVDFVLLLLPEHMAIGVHCDEVEPDRYLYCGDKRYCYMETTKQNWQIGQTPEDYLEIEVGMVPIDASPHLLCIGLRFRSRSTSGSDEALINVECAVQNQGPGSVMELLARVSMVEMEEDSIRRVLAEQTYPLKDLAEGEKRSEEFALNSPIKENSVLEVELIGAESSTPVYTMKIDGSDEDYADSQSGSVEYQYLQYKINRTH